MVVDRIFLSKFYVRVNFIENFEENVGFRAVTEDGEALLEAHILDFDEDLYGKSIEVIFRHKIRDEVKFDGLEMLKAQMATDVAQVREVLNAAQAQRA